MFLSFKESHHRTGCNLRWLIAQHFTSCKTERDPHTVMMPLSTAIRFPHNQQGCLTHCSSEVFIYFKGLLIFVVKKKLPKSILIVTCNSTQEVSGTVVLNTNIYYSTRAHYVSLWQGSIKINFYVSYGFFPLPNLLTIVFISQLAETLGCCFLFILFCQK